MYYYDDVYGQCALYVVVSDAVDGARMWLIAYMNFN